MWHAEGCQIYHNSVNDVVAKITWHLQTQIRFQRVQVMCLLVCLYQTKQRILFCYQDIESQWHKFLLTNITVKDFCPKNLEKIMAALEFNPGKWLLFPCITYPESMSTLTVSDSWFVPQGPVILHWFLCETKINGCSFFVAVVLFLDPFIDSELIPGM